MNQAPVFITTLVLFFLAGCSQSTEQSLLLQDALRIETLPGEAKIIESNWVSGSVYGFYEFYLNIPPWVCQELVSGRDYIPCATQVIKSHDSFSGFNARPNIQLVHCEKSISNNGGDNVAIYRDVSSAQIFITYDQPV